MTTWRRKIAEYEAELYDVQEPSFLSKLLGLRTKGGEIEIKNYDNGEMEMEIELHRVRVPDGAVASAVVDGTAICEIKVHRGHGRLLLSAAPGQTKPAVSNGSVAEIHYLGEVFLKGTFRPD